METVIFWDNTRIQTNLVQGRLQTLQISLKHPWHPAPLIVVFAFVFAHLIIVFVFAFAHLIVVFVFAHTKVSCLCSPYSSTIVILGRTKLEGVGCVPCALARTRLRCFRIFWGKDICECLCMYAYECTWPQYIEKYSWPKILPKRLKGHSRSFLGTDEGG